MDLSSLLLIFAVAVLAIWFVSRPLLNSPAGRSTISRSAGADDADEIDHQRSALLAERDRILTALQDLDFDNVLGKIDGQDYPAQRAELVSAGAEVLRKLDQLEPNLPSASAEDRLEEAVQARRALKRQAPSNGDDDIERMVAARRRSRTEQTGGFCAKCGNVLQKPDKFCPKCGTPAANQ